MLKVAHPKVQVGKLPQYVPEVGRLLVQRGNAEVRHYKRGAPRSAAARLWFRLPRAAVPAALAAHRGARDAPNA